MRSYGQVRRSFYSPEAFGGEPRSRGVDAWDESKIKPAKERVLIEHCAAELRLCMWNYVGIVRSDKRLARAGQRLAQLESDGR